jgi:hypothetical protein
MKVICKNCSIEFEKTQSELNRSVNNFCSQKCFTELKTKNAKSTTRLKIKDRHTYRLIAESVLKRKLKKGEIVHHIDDNSQNNEIDNLSVLPSIRFHYDVHHANRDFEKYKLSYIILNGETTDIEPIINTCIRGHEYTTQNTYYTKTGRGCKTCVNQWQRNKRAKLKALKNEQHS